MAIEIDRVVEGVPELLATLAAVAVTDGHGNIRRLVENWADRSNRFDATGEALFVAREGDRVVGVCGLNVDPFTDAPRTGRVRRLFVLPSARRRGVARRLLAAVEAQASGHFGVLRVRAPSRAASQFYVACEFVPTAGAAVTHRKALSPPSSQGP